MTLARVSQASHLGNFSGETTHDDEHGIKRKFIQKLTDSKYIIHGNHTVRNSRVAKFSVRKYRPSPTGFYTIQYVVKIDETEFPGKFTVKEDEVKGEYQHRYKK